MKKLVMLCSAVAVLSACSTSRLGHNQPLEQWDNYAKTAKIQGADQGQAVAVFYRQQNLNVESVNIYINGDYQASLLDKGFTAATLCSSKNLVTSSVVTDKKPGNRTDGIKFNATNQQVTYIKVVAIQNGKPVLEFVAPEIAQQELKDLSKQTQTLSRVKATDCNQHILEAFELDANATFVINKSSYADILPPGKVKIQEFVQAIKEIDQSKIKKFVVNGYTDPEGSDAYNQKLSEKRANTVKNVLMGENITAPITAVGYGERDLVVTNCAAKYPHNIAARTQCNRPNRRVEILVYGE